MRKVLFLIAAMVPLVGHAAKFAGQPREWTDCTQDEECVVIKGLCAPVGVRIGYEAAAQAYFDTRAQTVKCTKQFWQPTLDGAAAKCWQGSCQTVGKEKKK